mmetsp:Transcript_30693/g.89894  ORF Transcript_30693/g.89894 Transcript_30693/m.89894 type:complete len:211 (+) Transcript_30693:2-634(+)
MSCISSALSHLSGFTRGRPPGCSHSLAGLLSVPLTRQGVSTHPHHAQHRQGGTQGHLRPGHGRGHSNAQPQATRGPSGGPARLGTEAGGEGGGGTGDGAGGGAGCRSGGDEGGSDIGGGVRAAGSVQAVSRQRWRDGWRREVEAARWRGDGERRRRRRRDEGVSDEGGDDGGGSCDGGDECSDLRLPTSERHRNHADADGHVSVSAAPRA